MIGLVLMEEVGVHEPRHCKVVHPSHLDKVLVSVKFLSLICKPCIEDLIIPMRLNAYSRGEVGPLAN